MGKEGNSNLDWLPQSDQEWFRNLYKSIDGTLLTTHRSPKKSSEAGSDIFELHLGLASFELELLQKTNRLTWHRNNRIPFNFYALQDTISNELPHLIDSENQTQLFDGNPRTSATYRYVLEKYDRSLELLDESQRQEFYELMLIPEKLTKVQYTVRENEGEEIIYSFGIENRLRPWDPAKMTLDLPRSSTWNSDITNWVLANHILPITQPNPDAALILANAINGYTSQYTPEY